MRYIIKCFEEAEGKIVKEIVDNGSVLVMHFEDDSSLIVDAFVSYDSEPMIEIEALNCLNTHEKLYFGLITEEESKKEKRELDLIKQKGKEAYDRKLLAELKAKYEDV